jgi:two-component system, cell cycle response regulator
MTIKNKIAIRVTLALVISTVAIIAIVAINIRLLNIQLTKDKANIVADITKDALTSHMVNGIMDKRDMFLSNISHIKGVQNLRIIRSENVKAQFGKTRENEDPVDEMDRDVVKTGKVYTKVSEDMMSANLRITVPYIANNVGNPNCLQCHNAKEGEVLGAITMNFDLADAKDYGIGTILKIIGISLISMLGVMYMLRRFLTPYLDMFTQLSEKIKMAHDGDYSQRVETELTDEAGDAALWFNDFMYKLQNTFGNIEQNIRTFIPKTGGCRTKDPITELEVVVNELADVYRFKRTIENDVNKADVYERIATLLDHRFGIKSFTFYETEGDKNGLESIVSTLDCRPCANSTADNGMLCRASRIGKTVFSDDFERICPSFAKEGDKHLCIPVTIGGKIGLIINISTPDEDEYKRIKELSSIVQNYLNEAASVIESKRLMEKLRESSLRDALTGLYNRRFLDEYLASMIPQIQRNKKKIAVFMIDMDHFKMVNDTYGHDVGDALLKRLSACISENIRESDVAFRYGGEEFVVILNDIGNDENVIAVAEKLREKVKAMKLKAGSEVLQKTISIGVAIFPDDADQIWKCIKFADTAMYAAKHGGRDQVVRFTTQLWSEEEGGQY